jgi:putative tricarboxylic transport membrane protein
LDRTERIASLVLVAFGLFVAYYSRQHLKLGMMISPGAGFIPFYIGIALIVLGILWLFNALVTRKAPESAEAAGGTGETPDTRDSRRMLILYRFLPGVLLVILYAWLFEKAGYILSTVLFMVGWQKVVEREGWLKTALVSLISAGAMYLLFAYVLKVFLPAGTWFA